MISSVSGGSFTSAYYGLYGDKIFTDYEQVDCLRKTARHLLYQPLEFQRLLNDLNGKQ